MSTLPLTEQTIAARLERLPNSRWHVTVTVILGVAIFFDSFNSLAIAYVLPAIIPAWHIAPEKIGGLISIANFGQALGALTFGWAAERFGRVTVARIAIALFAVMSFACAFTHSYEQLFVFRFVEGIGLGGEIPVASTYISEILRAERTRRAFSCLSDDISVRASGGGNRRCSGGAALRLAMDVHYWRSAGFGRSIPAALLPGIAALAGVKGPAR